VIGRSCLKLAFAFKHKIQATRKLLWHSSLACPRIRQNS
jgi:hypothetical protein